MKKSNSSPSSIKPWVQGSKELLEHSYDLMKKDQASLWRIAFICIDNAVEIMIKTYLTLPNRITRLSLSRGKRAERMGSFPQILDLLQEVAPKKLVGLDINELDWFHRVRNDLYHNGHGLLIEQKLVILYGEMARQLFFNLFQFRITADSMGKDVEQLGRWIQMWSQIDDLITTQMDASLVHATDYSSASLPRSLPEKIIHGSTIPQKTRIQLQSLVGIRQAVMSGEIDFRDVVTEEQLKTMEELTQSLLQSDS